MYCWTELRLQFGKSVGRESLNGDGGVGHCIKASQEQLEKFRALYKGKMGKRFPAYAPLSECNLCMRDVP